MKIFRFWIESLGVGILAACLLPLDFYQKNYPQIPGQDITLIVGAFALIHALVWLILRFIFRNSDRTCLAAYTLWGAFWFSRPVLSFIRHSCAWTQALYELIYPYRYAVVLGVFISVVLAAYLWLRKHPAVVRTTVKVLNIFMGVQLAILLGQIAHNVHEYVQLARHHQEKHSVQPDGDYPNIYHILLDAHPNLEGARLLGYDLQPFYDELNKLGFITFPTSRSNYCRTIWSVPSMLTMDYLSGDETRLKESTLYSLSQNNPVFDSLMQHGYQVQCATSHAMDLPRYPRRYTKMFACSIKDTFVIFMSQSSILWNLKTDLFLNFKGNYRTTHHACLEWLLSPLDHQPMYRYAHILCPHPPFVFSDNASATYGLMVQDHTTNTDAKLIPQIRANIAGIDAMVLPILKQLTQQPNPPIIILHSDHGLREFLNNVDFLFGNLLALYIPDTWKSDAKDLKFINLYRFILNHLFNDHRPYIEQNRQIIRGKDFDPVNNNWNHIPK